MYKYLISGLLVESDQPLDRIIELTNVTESSPQVTISTYSSADIRAPKQTVSNAGFSFSAIPGLSFTISGGNSIAIFADERIEHSAIILYLLGSAWGALCHQRGLFPLHCSAVALGQNAFACVADSGGGKSTLAASLCNDDVRHVCDDVAIVETSEHSPARVHAMPKGLKLWQESSDALGLNKQSLAFAEGDRSKHYVDAPRGPDQSTIDLKGIYEIKFFEDGETAAPRIEKLHGIEALKTVFRHIYKVDWLDLLNVSERALAQATLLASQVPVFRYTRQRSLEHIKESSAVLAAHMASISDAEK